MLERKPVVAGKFYPGQKSALAAEVGHYLGQASKPKAKAWAAMLPHAGYIYCGDVIGQTLAASQLPKRLIIFCPNHTGYGKQLGVWPEGEWQTPLGKVSVDSQLAGELLAQKAGYEPDIASHLGEHSIEVLLPFLQTIQPDLKIVPITVGTRNPHLLKAAGLALANVLAANPDAGVIISSDMNHYESHQQTLAKDDLALAKALDLDADGLLEVVEANNISMCGAGPMAIAIYAANRLGLPKPELISHTTSGPVSGDMGHTVGYAGLRLLKI